MVLAPTTELEQPLVPLFQSIYRSNHKNYNFSIVIGLKKSYFPLIQLSSCYRTVCYRTACYRTVCYRTVQ